MVVTVKVNFGDIKRLQKDLERFPIETKRGINRWGRKLANSLKLSVRSKAYFEGKLHRSIKWNDLKGKGKAGTLSAVGYAEDIIGPGPDRKVQISSAGPNIQKWIDERFVGRHKKISGRSRVKGSASGKYRGFLVVRPKDLLTPIYNRHLPKLTQYIKQELNKIK